MVMPFNTGLRPVARMMRSGRFWPAAAPLRPATTTLGGGMTMALIRHRLTLAEGLRAAMTLAFLLLMGHALGLPSLSVASLAALMLCLCDTGGTVRSRLPHLLAFTALGAVTYGLFAGLHPFGPAVVLPLAAPLVLCCSLARVWGAKAQSVGMWVMVVLALALDKTADSAAALQYGIMFGVGGLWAVLVTMVVWRINPNRPARRASAEIWRLLAEEVDSLRHATPAPGREWDQTLRAHRRDIRDAIEAAHALLRGTLRARGPLSGRAAQNLLQIEMAEQVSGLLVRLGHVMEHPATPEARLAAARALRLLRPIIVLIRQAILEGPPARPERLEQALSRMLAVAALAPELQEQLERLAPRLRAAMGIATTPRTEAIATTSTAGTQPRWVERVWVPLRANLTWRSAILRHSVRMVVVVLPALSLSFLLPGPLQHWLAITVVLTMQPFFTVTWQRVLGRVSGTMVGALLAALMTAVPAGTVGELVLLVPFSIIAFVARQVNYAAYIACLTPLVILFTETVEPGQNSWLVAGTRALFTLAGGITAIGACTLLWPTWERLRIRTELNGALRRYARFATVALRPAEPDATLFSARREAELSNNNLEASLSRALKEPGPHDTAEVEGALLIDAALRRIGGTLLAIRHDSAATGQDEATRQALADWAPAALEAMADNQPLPLPVQSGLELPALGPLGTRLVDQIRLVGSALSRKPGMAG